VETNPHDQGLQAFFEVRPRLFGIAYRMLGSAAEADDLVQDVWMRWQSADRNAVQDPPAYLATITTRLAINLAQSARSRREAYVGMWLPEPIDTRNDPRLGAERSEALGLAVLLLLEKLAPSERAAYILREAFDYPYEQIADVLNVSEDNARQLVSRARKHLTEGRRKPVSSAEQRQLLDKFIVAARSGDLAALEGLLAADVVSYSDGGGLVRAAQKPLVGRERVAKFIHAVSVHAWTGVDISIVEANGQGCLLMLREGAVVLLATIDASEHGIEQIMWMLRPSKLGGISRSPESVTRA
jgi:RNA polymerase sigma-70 factor (TIGR02957 family)